ncbi:cellulose binding domain-containing protein [Spirillospora sp. NPDC048911]|uniref:cellulose binding domain-containing protein n=1 Tax=Spirillospora sp. NPDC048911 TaxID=3364527 RepID=UPI0037132570
MPPPAQVPPVPPVPPPAPVPVPPPAAGRPPVSLDVTMPDVSAFYKTRGPSPGPATDRPAAAGRPPATGRPAAPAPVAGAATGAPRPPRAAAPEGDKPADKVPGRRLPKKLVVAPLLPVTALVIAVGVVAYAGSTSQISLNFGGGAHEPAEPRDGQVSERGGQPTAAGRQAGLVVAFRVGAPTASGFRATVTIGNRGKQPVNDWAIAFKIPNVTFVSATGGTVVGTGQRLYVRKAPGTPALGPGQKVRLTYVASGVAQPPSECVINKQPCVRV